ncbi:UNVERIFIED_CONTAM: putative serine/threonine-protein kinase WNK5 [Sesamum calycinum]|uniref:non-specific serine/threonine protein kinase n=1 Tax=Sesamum calycinum TaxID=2727403 RepID=A0AAW2NY73_9LAMI
MYASRVRDAVDGGQMLLYVEMDPSERYGRFKDVLGKGAMKTVYRAFDELLGMEVAWNQVKLNDVFGSPQELQRLYSEVHLLKSLNHDSVMRSRASWIDVERRTFNFITEMFTSGTLREYRKKYKRVNIRAIKDWARQILKGLDYLHSHDPPVIHRDLKCDNIFVNGHLGQVKIGDLGLAAILRGTSHAHSVIGNHLLFLVYIYRLSVQQIMGKLPEAFYRIEDVEARRFVGRCLEKAANRPSARELLMDPFLSVEEVEEFPAHITKISSQKTEPSGKSAKLLPLSVVQARSTDMSITGTLNQEDDTIFLKVHISDKDGAARNIYFPFDIMSDTSLDVATEMVKELEITDWDPLEIANMIDEEISTLVPSWKDSCSSLINQQYSFNYADEEDDNDDNGPHHPFYSTSSFSSSHASLPGLFSLHDAQFYQAKALHDWHQEDTTSIDDASSISSSCSDKCSNLKYYSANEEGFLPSSDKEEIHCIPKTPKCTRFGPEGSTTRNCNNFNVAGCSSKRQQKMVRTRSMVDIRSQLLHRTLVEEINKRRLFKTVGAVEHVGYHDVGDFSGGEKTSSIAKGKSVKEYGIRGFKMVMF